MLSSLLHANLVRMPLVYLIPKYMQNLVLFVFGAIFGA